MMRGYQREIAEKWLSKYMDENRKTHCTVTKAEIKTYFGDRIDENEFRAVRYFLQQDGHNGSGLLIRQIGKSFGGQRVRYSITMIPVRSHA